MISVVALSLNIYLMGYLLRKINASKRPTDAETSESIKLDEPALYGSREVQALNRSFDERIALMEAELGTTTLYDESTPAPSYDPRVVALPHDSVRIAPKVEHEYAQ